MRRTITIFTLFILTGLHISCSGSRKDDATVIRFENEQVQIGTIDVEVRLGPVVPQNQSAVTDFVDRLNILLFSNTQTPKAAENFLRYLIAAIVAISSMLFSFLTFGRNIARGLEAMGRNPLAKRQIQVMIMVNTLLIVVVSMGGIILALAIIRF